MTINEELQKLEEELLKIESRNKECITENEFRVLSQKIDSYKMDFETLKGNSSQVILLSDASERLKKLHQIMRDTFFVAEKFSSEEERLKNLEEIKLKLEKIKERLKFENKEFSDEDINNYTAQDVSVFGLESRINNLFVNEDLFSRIHDKNGQIVEFQNQMENYSKSLESMAKDYEKILFAERFKDALTNSTSELVLVRSSYINSIEPTKKIADIVMSKAEYDLTLKFGFPFVKPYQEKENEETVIEQSYTIVAPKTLAELSLMKSEALRRNSQKEQATDEEQTLIVGDYKISGISEKMLVEKGIDLDKVKFEEERKQGETGIIITSKMIAKASKKLKDSDFTLVHDFISNRTPLKNKDSIDESEQEVEESIKSIESIVNQKSSTFWAGKVEFLQGVVSSYPQIFSSFPENLNMMDKSSLESLRDKLSKSLNVVQNKLRSIKVATDELDEAPNSVNVIYDIVKKAHLKYPNLSQEEILGYIPNGVNTIQELISKLTDALQSASYDKEKVDGFREKLLEDEKILLTNIKKVDERIDSFSRSEY